TSGDMIDYVFQTVPGWRPAYTPEVRPDKSLGHAPWRFSGLPEAQIEPCFKENLAASLAVINCSGHNARAAGSTLTATTASPPQRCQVVQKCWEVFRNWVP